ncbi:MAG: UDP-3-O-(3-hydroxymyristoyl)glucosamine N-acyltransferase [Candidatus Omnitrophota bacterium]|jgi:UDP-3-O-[3-hydroxymyristoyl] glucosamine N-acyltransferase
MKKTLKEIASFLNGEIIGDGNTVITGVAGIEDAAAGDITFIANPKYRAYLDKTEASAVITSKDMTQAVKPIIRVDNPSLAFVKIVSFILPSEEKIPQGIHPTAVVGKDVRLGKQVALGPHVIVEDGVSIGDKTVIWGNSYLGHQSTIGRETIIYPNVSIREKVSIGNNVIIHSGTVVGSDGFGYVTVEGTHYKIPQVGIVIIEDDVEIGSNVSIDRARFDKTVIGRGTKIDNLVHIAHNCIIGKNCLIIAQVGISGSTSIGNNVILAGQVGLVGHIKVGNNSIVMAQSGVSKSLPDGSVVWGTPAKPASIAKRVSASMQQLPRLFDTIRELKKKIEELESKVKNIE